MGKYDRFVNMEPSAETRNNWRFAIEEFEERARSMVKMIAYAAAKEVYDAVLEGIPGGNDYSDLKKSLKLVEVSAGKKGKSAAYAIYVNPKGRRVKKIDVGRTLITIMAKRGRRRPDDDIVFLETNGPWTADTIPFWPNKSKAIIVQRKVSKQQVADISAKMKKKMPDFISQLAKMGRRIAPIKPNSPGRLKRNAKAVPDVAMQALSLEFGSEGGKSKPIFRKSIMATKKSMGGLPERFVEIREAMTNPNSKKYKNWPGEVEKVSSSVASGFRGFQKRLGF